MTEKTKIAVVGSRTFCDYERLCCVLDNLVSEHGDVELVSGGAQGADSLAKRYADENNINITVYRPKWNDLSHPDALIKENKYGRYDARAGHRRNTLIIQDSDIVVAFHNGSRGTADSIKKAKELGKKLIEETF